MVESCTPIVLCEQHRWLDGVCVRRRMLSHVPAASVKAQVTSHVPGATRQVLPSHPFLQRSKTTGGRNMMCTREPEDLKSSNSFD